MTEKHEGAFFAGEIPSIPGSQTASGAEPALVRLARFVAQDLLDADPATLAILRSGVIDALGCIHAGVQTDVARLAREGVRAMASIGPATVIGTDMTTNRPQAAFLNAVAGHALDFDDWEIPGNAHPTVVLLPALLAMAGPQTNGADLARAYLAGFEVIARLGEAMNFQHYDAGWHSTATLGAPATAAACARLIGLSASQTAHAMSFAISAASGYTCQFGSHAKPIQAGFAARAGVEAACLAQAGLTGQPHVLDHARGSAALMGGLNTERMNAALDKLGTGYALTEHGLVLKPWPSCGYTHRLMTCAVRMQARLSPGRIKQIDLHLPDFHAAVLPFGQPTNRPEALFSAPFVVVMGLLHGGLTLSDLEAGVWNDPKVARLIAKTKMRAFAPIRPDLNYSEKDPDRIVVSLTDGRVIEDACAYPLGAPQAPMSDAQIWEKFRANAGPYSDDWAAKLCDWPEHPDIATLLIHEGVQS
ncbi:MmgE/PrpD family protein [Ruegeria sp. R14_0]|uniref:MmgE/PrpD family protein n=1 Tax=Ruegeria sp. R14_0 TaxID=2821100 RepID=UPI001ADC467C|nr:MmgE/PrpD family protein [Ruegeria sp. R14_0]MBO9446936.1 MmgE/PrpD family protein [Ruegeria sp. R14_0]